MMDWGERVARWTEGVIVGVVAMYMLLWNGAEFPLALATGFLICTVILNRGER